MKICAVIINPNSGKGSKKNEKKILDKLSKYGYTGKIYYTEYPHHAEEIVLKIKADLLISIGGDGTFYEVMNGNFQRKKPILLSHIPVGTTNDIGHMYGLSNDIIKNFDAVLSGTIKNVDICTINNRSFVYVASFGKFMEIPYETPQKLKKRLGHMAYLINGAKDLFKKTKKYNVTYEIDGIKHHGDYTFIIISNANRIAGINNFYRDMKLNDKKFEVMFCSINKLSQLAKAFYTLKTSDISYISGIECYKTDNLKITFNNELKPWCLDGEKFEDLDGTYIIETKKEVEMLVPVKNVDKLFL